MIKNHVYENKQLSHFRGWGGTMLATTATLFFDGNQLDVLAMVTSAGLTADPDRESNAAGTINARFTS